jgi:uncharacterized protein YeaO (DUF488 family)
MIRYEIEMLLGIKRIYDKAGITEGKRVLVDRLWPRGVKRSTSNIDVWLKEVAPSTELREWFSHDPEKWEEFKERYRKELKGNKAFDELVKMAREGDITLIYSSKDETHNNAEVLQEEIQKALNRS